MIIPLFIEYLGLVPNALVRGLIMGTTFGLVASGLALIWGVVDIVNFAHGEFVMIAMYVAIFGANNFGISPFLLIPVNVALLFALGYITHMILIKRLLDGPLLAQVLATFGLLLFLRYGAVFFIGPDVHSMDAFIFSGETSFGGVTVPHPQAISGLMSLVTLLGIYLFLRKTKTGNAIRATAQDRKAARLMGVNPDRVYAITWGVGLGAVGVAGTMVATFFPVQPELTPNTYGIISFAVVAIGGFGSVFAALFGGIAVGVLQNVAAVLFDPGLKTLYVFLILIIGLLFRTETREWI